MYSLLVALFGEVNLPASQLTGWPNGWHGNVVVLTCNSCNDELVTPGLVRRATLEEALRIDPSHAEAHIRMSNLYRRQGKTDLSLEHSQLAWRYGQSSALVLSIFAGKAADGGDYEKAILLQRRAAQRANCA